MTLVSVPWGAWYGDNRMELSFPADSAVIEARMRDAPTLSDEAIGAALRATIGSPWGNSQCSAVRRGLQVSPFDRWRLQNALQSAPSCLPPALVQLLLLPEGSSQRRFLPRGSAPLAQCSVNGQGIHPPFAGVLLRLRLGCFRGAGRSAETPYCGATGKGAKRAASASLSPPPLI